jgi:hypothetical protein
VLLLLLLLGYRSVCLSPFRPFLQVLARHKIKR